MKGRSLFFEWPFTFLMESKINISESIRFSLNKNERLNSKKVIDELFAEGDSLLAYPIKVVFKRTKLSTKYPVQAAFTASKKSFKRAVHRNQIKRLLRESYRLNKIPLYQALKEDQVAIFFIFIGKQLPTFSMVENAMQKAIIKTINQLEKNKKCQT